MKTKRTIKLKQDGNQVRVYAGIHLEPELWDLCKRKGELAGLTRSKYIRKILIQSYFDKCKNIKNIDWFSD